MPQMDLSTKKQRHRKEDGGGDVRDGWVGVWVGCKYYTRMDKQQGPTISTRNYIQCSVTKTSMMTQWLNPPHSARACSFRSSLRATRSHNGKHIQPHVQTRGHAQTWAKLTTVQMLPQLESQLQVKRSYHGI